MTDQQNASITKKVSLILSQCRNGDKVYSFTDEFLFNASLAELQNLPLVQPLGELGNIVLQNEQVHLLRALFQAQNDAGREVVVRESAKALTLPECSAQAFTFIARYSSFSAAMDLLSECLGSHPSTSLLTALSELLRCDHGFISDPELDNACLSLKVAIQNRRGALPPRPSPVFVQGMGYMSHIQAADVEAQYSSFAALEKVVAHIEKQVSRIQYIRLMKELRESANFEINQDRDKLLDSLGSMGFSEKLTQFLRLAESEFTKAQDAFSYKAAVDHVRAFFSELLTETAEKVASSRSRTLAIESVDVRRPVEVRDYLKRAGFLSEQFEILITGLYKFMSDEGTHTLGATKDVARIARNITIEVGLLVTKRVREFQATPAP